MKRLLDIEFHKFRYSKSSIVLTIIYLTIVILMMLIGLLEVTIQNGTTLRLADLGIFDFPYVWHLSTWFISFLKFLIAIVIVSLVANEYSNRTLKQNLIDGLSKKELILSKFYFIVVFTTLLTVLVFVVCLLLGLIYSNFTEINLIFRDLEYLGAFFISHLAFFAMCLFAGVLVKRSAFALGLIGIWTIFELILWAAASFFDGLYGWNTWEYIQDFLPMFSSYNLIVEPFTKVSMVKQSLEMISQNEFTKDYSVRWINIIVCSIWTALFTYWSYVLLKRRDL